MQPKTPTDNNRVVFCIEALTVGGAEQMLVAMANQFSQDGWQVHMVCLTTAGELAANLDSAVTLHVLDKSPGVDWRLPKRLRTLISTIDPIAVNSHLWTGNLWTRLALWGTKYKAIVTEHSRDTWKSAHHRLIDRVLARNTKYLVAVSNDTADFYREQVGIKASLVTVINNGVDTANYAKGDGSALRSEWKTGDELLIGTVGRLVPAKNHARLVATAAILKAKGIDAKVLIAGEGEGWDQLTESISAADLNDYVVMLGKRLDVPNLLHALDIFILTSDREGHPLTALEAQAAGTPVVLTDAGGSSDAIAGTGDQKYGLLVEQSEHALADAIMSLHNDRDKLSELGEKAQSYALAHFDKRQMIDAYQTLFLS